MFSCERSGDEIAKRVVDNGDLLKVEVLDESRRAISHPALLVIRMASSRVSTFSVFHVGVNACRFWEGTTAVASPIEADKVAVLQSPDDGLVRVGGSSESMDEQHSGS